ncbi:MAG TPA: peptide chain release factor N(5)-glutamine methyltransferase [Candidatus Acidoferrales bacterium]|nr:peptide chain release factor N(5)-glutamine methyltransferase [Candidatus Acidoferrales bacterium]
MQTENLTANVQPTVRHALAEAAQFLTHAGIESARLDAEVLLGHALGMERAELYIRRDSALTCDDGKRFQELLARRAKSEPVAYITGHKEFWSLDLMVTPDVLIPRPETELLVELTLAQVAADSPKTPLKILDIGTGSGAVAIALAKELPTARIWAVDASAAALIIANSNARRHGVAERIRFLHGNLFDPITELGQSFDFIVSNPPYVLTKEITTLAREIHDWEPKIALDGGPDGLDYYRRIIAQTHEYLAPEGRVLLEIGAEIGAAIAELFARTGGFERTKIYQDYAGKDRVIGTSKLARVDSRNF